MIKKEILSAALLLILLAPGCYTPAVTQSAPGHTMKPADYSSPGRIPDIASAAVMSNTGEIEIQVTGSATAANITSIKVELSSIQIHREVISEDGLYYVAETEPIDPASQPASSSGWITVPINTTENPFDLKKLTGLEDNIAGGVIEAGIYPQIRFMIKDIRIGLNGKERAAQVPSREVRFVHPFEISPGQKTVLRLDFDAQKSINVSSGNKITIKPAVKLITIKPEKPGLRLFPASSLDYSRTVAEDFVRSSATFSFDGLTDSLILSGPVSATPPDTFTFTFEFTCRYGGYGNRTGQILIENLTPHRAVVKVSGGTVVEAVLDGQWDMIRATSKKP